MNIIFFLLGLVFASFLNALMYRLDNEYKYPEILIKPSHCEKCKKKLKASDLIPIISYIFTKGKCSKCKSNINIYYPISELILGVSFFLFFTYNLPFYTYLILLVLFCLSYFDIKHKAIPQTPTLLFLISGIIFLIVNSLIESQLILNAVVSGIILFFLISVLLIVMYGIKNFNLKDGLEGFGMGDFLIYFTLSMFLDTQAFWIMFWLSIILTIIYFIPNLILGKMNRKTALPLLPFITLGYIVVVIYGEIIYNILENYILI